MSKRSSLLRRVRRRVNRRFYRLTFRIYRWFFPTPRWSGPLDPASLRRILIIRDDRVGDMVLTTPLLSFLKDVAPHAEIDVLASHANAAIVKQDHRIARLFVNDHTWRSWARLLPRMRARRYDLVINPITRHPYRQGIVASVLASRHTYKVSGWRPVRFQGLFTKAFRVPPRVTHMAELILAVGQLTLGRRDMVGRNGLDHYPLCLCPDARSDARIAAFLAHNQLENFVVVNVSAGAPSRDWPPDRAAAVVTQLLERHDRIAVVVTPAPGKEEYSADVGRRCADSRVLVTPAFPLLDLIALVRRALMVVTPDTALVHIASATGRPVLALYAPQDPRFVPFWLPVGVPYRVLASPMGGSVGDISPRETISALGELFDEIRRTADASTASR